MWSVGEPGNMTGNRPTPEAEKVEPPAAWTEMVKKVQTYNRCLSPKPQQLDPSSTRIWAGCDIVDW